MEKINIAGKDYELKLTLESWKKLKIEHDITPVNSEEKLTTDMAATLSALVYYAIDPELRKGIDIDIMDANLDFKVSDKLRTVILKGLPPQPEAAEESEEPEGEESGKK